MTVPYNEASGIDEDAPLTVKFDRKRRRCLGTSCNSIFDSEGPWNRICPQCHYARALYDTNARDSTTLWQGETTPSPRMPLYVGRSGEYYRDAEVNWFGGKEETNDEGGV